jgi:D-tyrosyl-tRNA(Tyr) deacylase
MIAVVQRVRRARVLVADREVGAIGAGLLVLLGVARDDGVQDADYLADKLTHLRIFEDDAGKMNRSLVDISGQMLVVSQFTLLGDCRKGRRPSFIAAAPPTEAEALYQRFLKTLRDPQVTVATGVFGAEMAVELINDGPVTLIVESMRHHRHT